MKISYGSDLNLSNGGNGLFTINARPAKGTTQVQATDALHSYRSFLETATEYIASSGLDVKYDGSPRHIETPRGDIVSFLRKMEVPIAFHGKESNHLETIMGYADGKTEIPVMTDPEDLNLTWRAYTLGDKIFKMSISREGREYDPAAVQQAVLTAASIDTRKERARQVLDVISQMLSADTTNIDGTPRPTIVPYALQENLPKISELYEYKLNELHANDSVNGEFEKKKHALIGEYHTALAYTLSAIMTASTNFRGLPVSDSGLRTHLRGIGEKVDAYLAKMRVRDIVTTATPI